MNILVKECVDSVGEGYEFVVCDNCGVVLFMKEYVNDMF